MSDLSAINFVYEMAKASMPGMILATVLINTLWYLLDEEIKYKRIEKESLKSNKDSTNKEDV